MTYAEAVEHLDRTAQPAAEAVRAEHDRLTHMIEDLEDLYVRQSRYLEQVHRERQECAAGARSPGSVAADPVTPADALCFLDELSAWFCRRQALDLARQVGACRQALAGQLEQVAVV